MEACLNKARQVLQVAMVIAFFCILYFPIEKLLKEEVGVSIKYAENATEIPSLTFCPDDILDSSASIGKGMNLSLHDFHIIVPPFQSYVTKFWYYTGSTFKTVNTSNEYEFEPNEFVKQPFVKTSFYLSQNSMTEKFSLFRCFTVFVENVTVFSPNKTVIWVQFNTSQIKSILIEVHDASQASHQSDFRKDYIDVVRRGTLTERSISMIINERLPRKNHVTCNKENSLKYSDVINSFYMQKLNCSFPWLTAASDPILSSLEQCNRSNDVDNLIDLMINVHNREHKTYLEVQKAIGDRNCRTKSWTVEKTSERALHSVNVTIVGYSIHSNSKVMITSDVVLYGFPNFVADFGGYLGLLLGASVISIFDAFFRLLMAFKML